MPDAHTNSSVTTALGENSRDESLRKENRRALAPGRDLPDQGSCLQDPPAPRETLAPTQPAPRPLDPPAPRPLSKNQFEALVACLAAQRKTQREIAVESGLSLGSVNKALKELKEAGYVDASGRATDQGKQALQPYRVNNAVILAAGMATRFAPLSFEKPKAMFEVRGEVIIERMIRQLQQAGIADITVVVGYMKETFFYLEDDFGVKIVVNPLYADRNNHASLFCVRDALANTYVCCSDEYYAQDIFRPYVYRPYVSVVQGSNLVGKYVAAFDASARVASIERMACADDAWYCAGPAYFDRAFSQKLMNCIEAEYDDPATVDKLWDDILAEHLSELEIYAKPYAEGAIYEFDTITDLVAFDRDFFANVDSRILDNICTTLHCVRDDITDVAPVKAGLTNLSTLFSVRGKKYIYRHPGTGTEEIVNRKAEAAALRVAKDLGLDDTFVYEDPEEGWKISRFIEGCHELDYSNRDQVKRALQMARALHTSGASIPYSFDFYNEGAALAQKLKAMGYPLPRDFDALAARVGEVAVRMRAEAGAPVLCHNDFYGPNFLVRELEGGAAGGGSAGDVGGGDAAGVAGGMSGGGRPDSLSGSSVAGGGPASPSTAGGSPASSSVAGGNAPASPAGQDPVSPSTAGGSDLASSADQEMRLIDWEYAAMGDAACDLGNFVAQGSGYSIDQALDILPLYYGRAAAPEEARHFLAAVGVVGWYWYVWAMYKGALGNPVGEWLYIWYRAAKQFTEAAEERYLEER